MPRSKRLKSLESPSSSTQTTSENGSTNGIVNPKDNSILSEADYIAGAERSKYYGSPSENHQRIADIWNVVAKDILGDGKTFSPRLVGLMMIGLKLARESNCPKRDNLVDIAGYVKCIDLMGIKEYEK